MADPFYSRQSRRYLCRWVGLVALAAGLTSCGSSNEPDPREVAERIAQAPEASELAVPDLAACPRRELLEQGLRQRTAPIAVPAPLLEVARSDMDNLAVITLGGSTVCVDASWMEAIENARLSPDRRFLEFDWSGYEAFGHVLVDRTGSGSVIDTGVTPVRSPSGERLAALDYSASGYGALNALAVWEIGAGRLTEIARIETLPDGLGWRIDRWVGERCLEISSIGWEDAPQDQAGYETAPRQRYVALLSAGTWQVRSARSCAEASR
jgi:hypothetical protein